MSGLFKVFLAGIAVGILIAPEKGSSTRRKISGYAGDLKEKWNGLFEENDEQSGYPRQRRTVDELMNDGTQFV